MGSKRALVPWSRHGGGGLGQQDREGIGSAGVADVQTWVLQNVQGKLEFQKHAYFGAKKKKEFHALVHQLIKPTAPLLCR